VSFPRCLPLLPATLALAAFQTQPRAKEGKADFEQSLPALGTRLPALPPGPGKAIADRACLRCHSAEILLQQRLSEKQWKASVEKMVRWGAEVAESEQADLVAYLAKHFGPDNDRFRPVVTRPVGR
jgi:mono/diheme cytochrome c family protein